MVYTITAATHATDGMGNVLWAFDVATTAGLTVGQRVSIAGCGYPFDGPRTITHLALTQAQALDIGGWDDSLLLARQARTDPPDTIAGTIVLVPSWVTLADLSTAVGKDVSSDTWAALAVDAANDWAYDTRHAAGYKTDMLYPVPSQRVKLGTLLCAQALYKERGSVDSYASFEELGNLIPVGSFGQILRMLGCKKPRLG